MIAQECFKKEWILGQRKHLQGVDPTLLEKTILALELPGRLAEGGLRFVFKGGTSLLLLLEDFKRLSIDVDIVCEETGQHLRKVFDGITRDFPFKKWEEDLRKVSNVPKSHYKFFFDSQVNGREDYVLLDVLTSGNIFPRTRELPIDLGFIKLRRKTGVVVPTIESLIGDKLTAFAPHTTGIPMMADRTMQIIKQLFDLGELFVKARDLREIAASYDAFVRSESRFRRADFSPRETLQDTLDTCFLIAQLDLKASVENEETRLLRRGIKQIQSHLINSSFTLTQAKIAASRVAFLATALREDATLNLDKIRFHEGHIAEIRDTSVSGDWKILNRLKPISPESFYYWHLADRLSKGKR